MVCMWSRVCVCVCECVLENHLAFVSSSEMLSFQWNTFYVREWVGMRFLIRTFYQGYCIAERKQMPTNVYIKRWAWQLHQALHSQSAYGLIHCDVTPNVEWHSSGKFRFWRIFGSCVVITIENRVFSLYFREGEATAAITVHWMMRAREWKRVNIYLNKRPDPNKRHVQHLKNVLVFSQCFSLSLDSVSCIFSHQMLYFFGFYYNNIFILSDVSSI